MGGSKICEHPEEAEIIRHNDPIPILQIVVDRKLEKDPVQVSSQAQKLLDCIVMTNTWDTANRLVESQRDRVRLEPVYNGVGDRVGQTVGTTTIYFALDVTGGLPEVI